MEEKQFIGDILKHSMGKTYNVKNIKFLSGGCINQAVRVECEKEFFFIKWNKISFSKMFESEAKSLTLLRETNEIKIPEVIGFGTNSSCSYLILEYIHSEVPSKDYWSHFGLSLSRLHRHSQTWYGLTFDNYIGALPQSNQKTERWIDFFIQRRLMPQIRLARDAGKMNDKTVSDFDTLIKKLATILIEEEPALLHGDLWTGNVMTSGKGLVCLVDPAVYYGHREMEIAFTLLFGGFPKEFYDAYFENFPVEQGFERRVEIYNLYPLLVHLNLFGGSYLNQILEVLKKWA